MIAPSDDSAPWRETNDPRHRDGASNRRCRIVFSCRGCENDPVPLSDDEQRILREIEDQLSADEKFASAVSSSGLYRHSAKRVWWSLMGVVACLVAMVFALQIHYLLAFAAFIGMLVCALVIERQLRLIGRAGVQDLAQKMPKPRVKFTRE